MISIIGTLPICCNSKECFSARKVLTRLYAGIFQTRQWILMQYFVKVMVHSIKNVSIKTDSKKQRHDALSPWMRISRALRITLMTSARPLKTLGNSLANALEEALVEQWYRGLVEGTTYWYNRIRKENNDVRSSNYFGSKPPDWRRIVYNAIRWRSNELLG